MDINSLIGLFIIFTTIWGLIGWINWGLIDDKRKSELEEYEALKKAKETLERENNFLKSRITKYELAESQEKTKRRLRNEI